jgi:hypothetical protein
MVKTIPVAVAVADITQAAEHHKVVMAAQELL